MIDIVKSNQFYETLDLDSTYIFIQTLSSSIFLIYLQLEFYLNLIIKHSFAIDILFCFICFTYENL